MLRWPMSRISYLQFVLLDHLVWLLIQVLPGPQLIGLARRRPWQVLAVPMPVGAKHRWRNHIAWLLRRRCQRAGWGSSCLSRSLSGRLLLDLIGVANVLHLGMNSGTAGDKVPHAWLSDPGNGSLLTPGLQPGAGAPLTQL